MSHKKKRYVNTSPKVEANRLRVIFQYMKRKGLDHESLMKEIVDKKCGLPTAHREYIILRDYLGSKIKTEIQATDESTKDNK